MSVTTDERQVINTTMMIPMMSDKHLDKNRSTKSTVHLLSTHRMLAKSDNFLNATITYLWV